MEPIIATLKTLQVAEAMKDEFLTWWEQHTKNGSAQEQEEFTAIMIAVDEKISQFRREEVVKQMQMKKHSKPAIQLDNEVPRPCEHSL